VENDQILSQLPLAALRVLDLSQGIAGPYCSKLFAALGADVIKMEPPEGDIARRFGPFPEDLPHLERSGIFLYANTGKQGITLDIQTTTGRDLFLQLVAWADITVESFRPCMLDSLDLGYEKLLQTNPKLILTSITPFGQSGPYREYNGSEAGAHAISGEMSLAGHPFEPLQKGGQVGQYLAGLHGFLGAMAALLECEETGRGQHVDVSVAEVLTSIIGAALREQVYFDRPPPRKQVVRAWPEGIHPCKDGYILAFGRSSGDWWPDFVAMLGASNAQEPGMLPQGPDEQDAWKRRFDAWLQTRTKAEVYHEAQKHRLSFGYVATAADLLSSPQLAHRGFFEQVEHPALDKLTLMGLPFLLDGERYPLGRAPLLGEHNEPVYCGLLGLSRPQLVLLRQLGVV